MDCYVLDDEERTAVISKMGMYESLGFAETTSGGKFLRFVSGKTILKYVALELKKKLQNPLIFQGLSPAPGDVHGYDVTILIDVCKAVLTAHANNELPIARYENVIGQAQVLTTASAKAGIKGLVYAITGYDATREEIIKNFRRYVAEEAQEYEREFPNQLYLVFHPAKNQTAYAVFLPQYRVSSSLLAAEASGVVTSLSCGKNPRTCSLVFHRMRH